jgi:hypothetical protein
LCWYLRSLNFSGTVLGGPKLSMLGPIAPTSFYGMSLVG